jgi:hypothetical protein
MDDLAGDRNSAGARERDLSESVFALAATRESA